MKALLIVTTIVMASASAAVAQQQYPDLPDVPVIFENEKVIAQEITITEPGKWAGKHSHPGNQLVVVVEGFRQVYRDGGKEHEKTYKTGDVFWVDAAEGHNHKAMDAGRAIIITLK